MTQRAPAPATHYDLAVFAAVLPAPFGAMGVRIQQDALVGLDFLPPGTPCRTSSTALINLVTSQLAAYYANAAHRFDLPIAPVGTPYRLRVWQALSQIPAGQTRSYGEIAHALASGPRAVGQAVGDNPIPIIIPCHRVIAAGGGLGGFMHSRTGYSQDIKRWLLKHEHVL
ncbi:MAG: hypothetical protein B7Y41_16425 [Hydrogenophilales bacterium 28-61-23]|nr:MAG: hypothetical protein B7Y41_16425 [Hydrogenophilales bacterium 28-61-23]